LFKRGNIATKRSFSLYRSKAVEGVSGSYTEELKPDRVIYGRLKARNFGRMLEQGQINQDVTHEMVCDWFTPFPESGDKLKQGPNEWIIHVVENQLEYNQTLRLLISRDGASA